MIKYDKLVRDNIPMIIENAGNKCITEIMDNETYIKYLDRKLNEELEEYLTDKSAEELADLLEVIFAVSEARGVSIEELERIRRAKADKNGQFKKKILLKGVIKDGSN